ncbi:unnamed protein product, partial [marine sediment metagenome]
MYIFKQYYERIVARQFDKALKGSFKKEKGFPSFKKKN